jgi:hypothetical protein
VEKPKFVTQLSTCKNRNLGPKNSSAYGIKAIFKRLFIILSAMGILIAWLCVPYFTQALAGQVEIKDAPPPPVPPPLSTFAPAQDLVNQVQDYIKEMEETLVSQEEYNDTEGKIGRCASTLAVIALCLGLHDQDNLYKPQAAALMKAAEELAATKDYQSAKNAFEKVKAAAEGKAQAQTDLKWEKVASLPDLMKQVPNINTKLKRNLKGKKFKSKAKDTAGYTAAIAAIAQGSIADISNAKNAEEVKRWYEDMIHMRDAAGAANVAIHAGNEPAAAEAMKNLAQSCDDCHKVFHPEAILIEETDSQ